MIKYALGLAGISALLVAVPAGAASAETFTVNYASSGAPYVVPASETNVYTFGLPQFDSSLGSLVDVKLTLTSFDQVNVALYNVAATNESYSAASASASVAVNTSLYGLVTLTTNTTAFGAGSVAPGLTTLAGGYVTVQKSLTLTSSLAPFLGTGNLAYTIGVPTEIGSYSVTSGAPGGTLFVGGSATTYGNVLVEYDYATPSPVPEPGVIAMAGVGAAFLLAMRRRK